MRFSIKISFVLVTILAFAVVSQANPIQIDLGRSIVFPSTNNRASSDYTFEGIGLRGDGTVPFGFFPYVPLCTNNCNVVGSSLNLSSTFSTGTDMSIYPLGYSGRVQYLGNSYVVTQGQFLFDTNTGILPPVSAGSDYTTASMNHSMSATLILKSLSTSIPDGILILSGSGLATIDYVVNPTYSGLDIGFIRYAYSDVTASFKVNPTPEPVPEPATLLLMGTGLAGIVGFTRKRRLNKTL